MTHRTARGIVARVQPARERLAYQLQTNGKLPCARCGHPVHHDAQTARPGAHVPACTTPDCPGDCWMTWDLERADDGTPTGLSHHCCHAARVTVAGVSAPDGAPVFRSW